MTCFPLLGVGNYIDNPQEFAAPHSESKYVPDYIINPHPRFAALTENIRNRRGGKVDIRVPLFKDINTAEFKTSLPDGESASPYIDMDCMAFGMGMCCLVRKA